MFDLRLLSAATLLSWCITIARSHSLSRHLEVMNDSGRNVVVHWVDPSSGKLVRFSDPYLHSGSTMVVDTFVNHSFVFQDSNETSCSSVGDNTCHFHQVTIGENNDPVLLIRDGMNVEYVDNNIHQEISSTERLRSDGALEPCRIRAKMELEQGQNANLVMKEMMTCMEQEAFEAFQRKNEQKAYESRLRLQLSSQIEPYTCLGHQNTTTPQRITTWEHEGVTRDVGILHQRKASQIHVLKNFVSPEECEAIRIAAEPSLHRGTVADGNGGHKLSEHRKAWQAGIPMPFGDEENLIGRVGRRLYAYANHATGYNLTYPGQEDLMSIQYFGRGADDEAPDQYKPHCDGECAGMPHKTGGRVATMVMYCDVPKVGGGTNFQNSGVYVKPELGAAAFFSYMDSEARAMETGFTSHSGCPVIEGTKRIAVHWMRVGVDAENPWDSFNTLTIKKSDLADCD